MAKLALFAVPITLAGVGCSPFGGAAFHCANDTQCLQSGTSGVCESTGYCAFPDTTCSPPERYGESSGPFSGSCVSTGGQDDAKVFADARPFMDAHVDAPPGQVCYGNGLNVTVCFMTPPTGTIMLGTTINTDAGSPECSANPINTTVTQDWCVIAAANITANNVAVFGRRPLVLIATGMLSINGTLDAASHRYNNGNQVGAGSIPTGDTTSCNVGTKPGTSGGGAGGSFASQGGDGGNATGGSAGGTVGAPILRGGCYGQDGKTSTFGVKGLGGGAVYLFAGSQVSVSGAVNASGGAGTAGLLNSAGAGGGGSGGMIVFDAPVILNVGDVFANGGGGGEGAATTAIAGVDGREPTSVNPSGTAGGGTLEGGNGGTGAAQGTNAGNGGTGTGGGGGGGGGVGVIKVYGGGTLTGNVSPNPT